MGKYCKDILTYERVKNNIFSDTKRDTTENQEVKKYC